jgi:hypothetical protein
VLPNRYVLRQRRRRGVLRTEPGMLWGPVRRQYLPGRSSLQLYNLQVRVPGRNTQAVPRQPVLSVRHDVLRQHVLHIHPDVLWQWGDCDVLLVNRHQVLQRRVHTLPAGR